MYWSELSKKKLGFVVLTRAHELFSFPVSGLIAGAKKRKERPDEIKRVHRDFDGSSGWP